MLIALLIGLSSSLHCIGMCGPISLAIPFNRTNNATILFGLLQYNFGRITAYITLGLLIGSIGMTVSSIQWMQWLSIVAGVLMLVMAWHQLFTNRIKAFSIISGFISKNLGRLIRSKSSFKFLGMGMLNGFLPCGMVFFALTNALIQGTLSGAVVAMIGFGIGTLPAMFSVAYFANKIGINFRKKATRFVPYVLTVIGLLIIVRGMNLGIPYFSPKLKMIQATEMENTKKTVDSAKLDCCSSSNSCETPVK